MATYLTLTTVACMTRQQVKGLCEQMQASDAIDMQWAGHDQFEGVLCAQFEAESKDELTEQLAAFNFRYDRVITLQYRYE